MPKIPQRSSRLSFSSNVRATPTLSPSAAAAPGLAQAKLAKTIAGIATDIAVKKKKAADMNYVSSSIYGDLEAYAVFDREAKNDLPEDGSGFVKQTTEFFDKQLNQALESSPSAEASDAYRRRFDSLKSKALIDAEGHEAQQSASFFKKNISQMADDAAKGQVINPDSDRLTEELELLDINIEESKGIHFEDKQADALLKGKKNLAVKGYIKGLMDNKEFEHVNQMLDGKGHDGDLNKHLDANDVATLKKQAASAAKVDSGVKLASLTSQARNMKSALASGVDVSQESIASLVMQIDDKLKGDGRSNVIKAQLEGYKKLNGRVKSFSNMSGSEIAAGAEEFAVTDPSIASSQSEVLTAYNNQARKHLKERKDDPAGYVIKNNQDLLSKSLAFEDLGPQASQDYLTELKATQRAIGIPESQISVISKGQANELANRLKNTPTDEAKVQLVNGVTEKFGADAPLVFSELVAQKLIPADWQILPHIPNPATQATIINNITNKKEIAEGFKLANPRLNSSGAGGLKQMVSTRMEESLAALRPQPGDTSKLPLSNALQAQTLTLAQKKILQEGDVDDSRAQEIVDEAAAEIVDANFIQADGGTSRVLAPRLIGGKPVNEDLVKSFLRAHSKPENLEALNIPVPQSFIDQIGAETVESAGSFKGVKGTSKKAGAKERFYRQLSETATWDMNAQNDGMILVMLKNNRKVSVIDAAGHPIEKKYMDITERPSQATINESKNLFENIGDLLSGR